MCHSVSRRAILSDETKCDSVSSLDAIYLKHECGCHGSTATWTAGTWKCASSSKEGLKLSTLHHNKYSWQHMTLTPVLGESPSGWCCQLHTKAWCDVRHHKHTVYILMWVHNVVHWLWSKPCLGTHSLILTAIDPAGRKTEDLDLHDNCCNWIYSLCKHTVFMSVLPPLT